MFCRFCGKELAEGTKFCTSCGKATSYAEQQLVKTQVVDESTLDSGEIQVVKEKKPNCVLSIVGICTSIIPFAGLVLNVLGLIFCRKSKAGRILSSIGLGVSLFITLMAI